MMQLADCHCATLSETDLAGLLGRGAPSRAVSSSATFGDDGSLEVTVTPITPSGKLNVELQTFGFATDDGFMSIASSLDELVLEPWTVEPTMHSGQTGTIEVVFDAEIRHVVIPAESRAPQSIWLSSQDRFEISPYDLGANAPKPVTISRINDGAVVESRCLALNETNGRHIFGPYTLEIALNALQRGPRRRRGRPCGVWL